MAKEPLCIDTDICVNFLRKKGHDVELLLWACDTYDACITAVTAFELYHGHIKMNRKEAEIQGFLSQFRVLPFDFSASKTAAKILAELDKKGKGIGLPDTFIAAVCVTNNTPILTLNVKHFSRVPGLKLIQQSWPFNDHCS